MPVDKLPKKNATRKVPLALKPVPFEEAIEASMKRGVVLPEIYYGQLQGIERAEAFSIAGIASVDQLQHTLDKLTDALITGETFETWKAGVIAAPDVLDLPAHRLDNIFRTNIQGAYARGHCTHIDRNKDRRPFLMYSAINDDRTRPHHLAMNGHVAPVGDPIWQTWTPPCGYRCRCTVVSLSEAQSDRYRKRDSDRLANDPEAAMARAAAAANGPDQGWDYSPCGDGAKEKEKITQAKKPTTAKPLRPKLDQAATQAQTMRDAEDFTKWTKIEGKKGSNEGGLYQDALGRRWYAKIYDDPMQARSEIAAHTIIGKITGNAPKAKLLSHEGRTVYASEWVGGLQKIDPAEYAKLKTQLADHYAAAALLKNWDVIGAARDNLLIDRTGKLIMIDAGGAMKYRAQGGTKSFLAGPVDELQSFINPNRSASAVFGTIPEKNRLAAVRRLEYLTKTDIRTAFIQAGYPAHEVDEMTEAAWGRRKWMLGAVQNQATKAATNPAAITAAQATQMLQAAADTHYLAWSKRTATGWARRHKWTEADKPFFSAVKSYTGNNYKRINEVLREAPTPEMLGFARVANEGIARMDKYTGVVERGARTSIAGSKEWIDAHKTALATGKPIEYQGFLSTDDKGGWDKQVKLRIEAIGLQGAYIDATSLNQGEREIIFPHGSRFRVKAIREVKSKHSWEEGQLWIDLVEEQKAMKGDAIKLSAPHD